MRLVNACSSKIKELHSNPSSGAPIFRVVRNEREHGQTTESLNRPAPGDESAVSTTILDDSAAAKSAVPCWTGENEDTIGAGVWMWQTAGSRSHFGRVEAAAVCKHGTELRSRTSFLGTGCMELFDAELWLIGLTLDVAIEKRDTLQMRGVKTVAVFTISQTAIRRAAHLDLGHGKPLARRFNRRAQSLCAHCIATELHWVPGNSGIPANDEADRQTNLAHDASGSTVIELSYYTSALNRARRISKGRLAVNAQWEAYKCSKHFSYRLRCMGGTK